METKQETISEISELIERLTARFTADDVDEQQWMAAQCSPQAARVLSGLSVSMLHLLNAIPTPNSDQSINITALSLATEIPKGTVSKSVRRLVDDGVVERQQLPDNRKEVHIRLSSLGAEIHAAHRSLHEQMGDGLDAFLERYSNADLAVITRVLADLLRMPRDGLRFRPDLLD